MKCFPIIPIWIMLIFTGFFLFLLIRKEWQKNVVKIIIIILLFLMNLRIMIPLQSMQTFSNNLDVILVIDNTISMNAADYDGKTRLSRVREDCKYIIEELQGARFSVITFDNTSRIVIPFTKDTTMTREAIDILNVMDDLYARGTSLNTPLENILSSLKSSAKKEDKKPILFFMSDGEITDNSPLKSFQEVRNYALNGAILGYGTLSGGEMKIYNKYSNKYEFIMDPTSYEKAISKLDEENLKKIAKDMQLDYILMNDQNALSSKLKEIKKLKLKRRNKIIL